MPYNYDFSGKSALNAVAGESRALAPRPGYAYHWLIPNNGPFFAESLTISATISAAGTTRNPLNTLVTLTPNVDYVPVLQFTSASENAGKPICVGILFLDPLLTATLALSYQNLGGPYDVSTMAAATLWTNKDFCPAAIDYETALGFTAQLPDYTPVFDAYAPKTYGAMLASLAELLTKANSASPAYSALNYNLHYNDTNNPHGVTAVQLQLDKVPNFGVATQADVAAATSRALFVTPYSVAQATKSTANLPQASSTVRGQVMLNSGTTASDATDNVKALTSAAAVNLRNAGTSNAIKNLLTNGRKQFFFSPLPITYPCTFNGYGCCNFEELMTQVENYLQISNLASSESLGCFWTPPDITFSVNPINVQTSFGFSESFGAPFEVGGFENY